MRLAARLSQERDKADAAGKCRVGERESMCESAASVMQKASSYFKSGTCSGCQGPNIVPIYTLLYTY